MLNRIGHIGLFFITACLGLCIQSVFALFPTLHPVRRSTTRLILKCCLRSLGAKVHIKGSISSSKPIFFVSNHISYLDILVLGSVFDAAFISKSAVAKWPLFGMYARLQGAIFIDRSKASLLSQQQAIRERLRKGGSLILFPEGTTNTGIHTLPFKSSLFQVLEKEGLSVAVQPISIVYSHQRGIILGRAERHRLSWTGNLSLLPHVWILTEYLPLKVTVICQKPIKDLALLGRKQIAFESHRAVKKGLQEAFQ